MNDELESSVLSILLAHPEQSAPFAAQNFTASMFERRNMLIFAAFQKVFIENGAVTTMRIAQELQSAGHLETVGGMARLTALEIAGGVPMELPFAAGQLRDKLARQRLAALSALMAEQCASDAVTIGGILSESMAELEAIVAGRESHTAPSMKQLVMGALTSIQKRADGTEKGAGTGIGSLDRLTGGVRPASQWVIAGPAKGGKSSLALTILCNLVVKEQRRCAFFGLEMPSIENVERMLCHDGRVEASNTRDGKLNDWSIRKLQESAGRLAVAPLHFRDDLFELVELLSAIRQLKAAHADLFAVFVDYAQLVGHAREGDNREREVAGVSRALRKLSMTTGLAVFLLSQTNDDGRLRESRALGMDATKIITLDFTENPKVRLLKLTQRDGMSGIELQVAYNGEFFEFATLAEDEQ